MTIRKKNCILLYHIRLTHDIRNSWLGTLLNLIIVHHSCCYKSWWVKDFHCLFCQSSLLISDHLQYWTLQLLHRFISASHCLYHQWNFIKNSPIILVWINFNYILCPHLSSLKHLGVIRALLFSINAYPPGYIYVNWTIKSYYCSLLKP